MSFPAAFSGARAPIAETANKWARHFASSSQTCTDYMSRTVCKVAKWCERGYRSGLQGEGAAVGSGVPRRDGPENRH